MFPTFMAALALSAALTGGARAADDEPPLFAPDPFANVVEIIPTTQPTTSATAAPTTAPVATRPATEPATVPTTAPASVPTTVPTTAPTTVPTTDPTTAPTTAPTTSPTTAPATAPASVVVGCWRYAIKDPKADPWRLYGIVRVNSEGPHFRLVPVAHTFLLRNLAAPDQVTDVASDGVSLGFKLHWSKGMTASEREGKPVTAEVSVKAETDGRLAGMQTIEGKPVFEVRLERIADAGSLRKELQSIADQLIAERNASDGRIRGLADALKNLDQQMARVGSTDGVSQVAREQLAAKGALDDEEAWHGRLDRNIAQTQEAIARVDADQRAATRPATAPSTQPTSAPSTQPTTAPASQPTTLPSTQPTTAPVTQPSTLPTTGPTTTTTEPSTQPATPPATLPRAQTDTRPTTAPSTGPTNLLPTRPKPAPTTQPSTTFRD